MGWEKCIDAFQMTDSLFGTCTVECAFPKDVYGCTPPALGGDPAAITTMKAAAIVHRRVRCLAGHYRCAVNIAHAHTSVNLMTRIQPGKDSKNASLVEQSNVYSLSTCVAKISNTQKARERPLHSHNRKAEASILFRPLYAPCPVRAK